MKNKEISQNITPWEAYVNTEDKSVSINYDKIISQFGCKPYNTELTKKLEEFSGKEAHFYFKRNIVFAHRDFDKLLNKGNFYLYTGRGPSSKSMHLGHVIPFQLCKYFQDTFKCPLVIQLTDDEKFLFKNMSIDDSIKYGKENMKDIIAFGFDPNLTYIFSNILSSHLFEKNTLKISKAISLNEACKVFGFDMNSNIGMINFPAKEIAPCYASTFDFLKRRITNLINEDKTVTNSEDWKSNISAYNSFLVNGKNPLFIEKGSMCLIPCAVDQDPYFRLARDKSNVLKEPKPITLYVSLLPDLKGVNKKMSASDKTSSIFLTDTSSQIANKIRKYAYSGGKKTLEEHKAQGGDINIDIAYQYLRYFYKDEEDLGKIKENYEKGKLSTGEIKKKCIEVIQEFVGEYQERRSQVNDEILEKYRKITH